MGIVNVTPDSFSDGGPQSEQLDLAIEHGLSMVKAGAQILDIGGESTRPGSDAVSLQEELRRVLPVIEGLREAGVPLSIDTLKPQVMQAALDAGA
ncbi:MAG: dihydropteroate synthase, partial [Alcaligenaceae bacterium]|nr:dihydropteroate synthase [Alcaligenaceae bacterium]